MMRRGRNLLVSDSGRGQTRKSGFLMAESRDSPFAPRLQGNPGQVKDTGQRVA